MVSSMNAHPKTELIKCTIAFNVPNQLYDFWRVYNFRIVKRNYVTFYEYIPFVICSNINLRI